VGIDGGSVSVLPAANCPGGRYLDGTDVTLTAVPNPQYRFMIWSGNVTGDQNPITVTMTGPRLFSAHFAAQPIAPTADHALNEVYAAYITGGLTAAQEVAAQSGLILDGSRVILIIQVQGNPNAAMQALGSIGGIVQGQMGDQIQISLPIDRLADVASLPEVRTIIPPATAITQ
jgi:hypothetical protein